ncbi:MAG: flagellin [Candidatus Latescibacterota bacterium]|nr:flagellin [Candidatus Latescibacterota bacterium]
MALSFNSHIPVPYARRPQDIFESVSSVSIEDSGTHVTGSRDVFSGLALSGRDKSEAVALQFRIRNEEQAINSIRSAEFSLLEVRSILIRLRELAYGFSLETWSDDERELASDQFSELNTATQRMVKLVNSGIRGTTISEQQDLDSHELLPNKQGIELSNIVSIDAEPGVYSLSYIPEKKEITLSNKSNSQTIKFTDLLYKGAVEKIKSIILNFDRFGVLATFNVTTLFDETGMLAGDNITDRQFVVIEDSKRSQDEFFVSKCALEEFIGNIQFLSNFFKSEEKGPSKYLVIAHLERALEEESRIRGNLGYVLNRMASNIRTIEEQIEKIEVTIDKIGDSTTADTVLQCSQSRIVLQHADRLLKHARSVDPARVLRLLDI